jgi:outer membrane lipoprotein LolB
VIAAPAGRPSGHGASRSIAWLAAFVLAGCATVAPPPPVPGDAQFSGRLALRVEATVDAEARNFSSVFELRGRAEQGQFELSTPLGTMLARAQWQPGQARLATPQREAAFTDLEALTQAALGQSLPVAALFDWLAGRPWSGASSRPTPGGFEQLGWMVQVDRLVSDGALVARRTVPPPAVTLHARLDRSP